VLPGLVPVLQAGVGVRRVCRVLAPIVAARLTRHEPVAVGEAAPSGRGGARQRLAGVGGGNGGAVRVQGHATRPGGAAVGHGGTRKRLPRPRTQRRRLRGPYGGGWGRRGAGQALRGDGVEPLPGGGRPGAAVGDRQTGEGGLGDVPRRVCSAACRMALADLARGEGKAAVGGQGERLRVAHRCGTPRALAPGGCERSTPDVVREAAQERTRVVVAGQAVLQGGGDRPCPLPQTAVAQDPHQDAPPSVGGPHRARPTPAPSARGPRARGPGPGAAGGRPAGAAGAARGCDQGRAPGTAGRPPAREDLGGGRRRALQPADHRRCARIAWAGVPAGRAGREGCVGQPGGHGAGLTRAFPGAL
jgi:hypothetical protein